MQSTEKDSLGYRATLETVTAWSAAVATQTIHLFPISNAHVDNDPVIAILSLPKRLEILQEK